MGNFYSKKTKKGIYYGGSIGKFDVVPTTTEKPTWEDVESSIIADSFSSTDSEQEIISEVDATDWRSLTNSILVSAAPAHVPEEPKQDPAEPKQTTSKKKTGIIIALVVLAAAAFLFYPKKK